MGELFIGEYGISQEGATLDTIGVDPDCRHKGIGERLVNEFLEHLSKLDVKKVNTLVDVGDTRLMKFFKANAVHSFHHHQPRTKSVLTWTPRAIR